jgi:hypothetical protein
MHDGSQHTCPNLMTEPPAAKGRLHRQPGGAIWYALKQRGVFTFLTMLLERAAHNSSSY